MSDAALGRINSFESHGATFNLLNSDNSTIAPDLPLRSEVSELTHQFGKRVSATSCAIDGQLEEKGSSACYTQIGGGTSIKGMVGFDGWNQRSEIIGVLKISYSSDHGGGGEAIFKNVPLSVDVVTLGTGAIYLQVTALRPIDAANLMGTLRAQNLPALTAETTKPDLVRVMVGPYRQMADAADAKLRLQALGFANVFLQNK